MGEEAGNKLLRFSIANLQVGSIFQPPQAFPSLNSCRLSAVQSYARSVYTETMFITRAVTRKASPWLGVREDKGQSPILLIKKKLIYLSILYYLLILCVHICCGPCVEVRRQFVGVHTLLPLCGPGGQAQVPRPGKRLSCHQY